jgi:hypothetical protein
MQLGQNVASITGRTASQIVDWSAILIDRFLEAPWMAHIRVGSIRVDFDTFASRPLREQSRKWLLASVGWVEPTGPAFGRPVDKLRDTHQLRFA